VLLFFRCSIDFNYQGHCEAYIMSIFVKFPLFCSQAANILGHIFRTMPGQLFPVP
jgi:hypothetical protein